MAQVRHQRVKLNGIDYHFAESGAGPIVVLLHGFPEFWYSWRHQLPALAEAGYHAIAPDLRGFGDSTVSPRVEDYSLLNHAEDVHALIDALGEREVVLAGHDWGANLTWAMALKYPDRIRAVIALSIPFYPAPRDPEEVKKFSPGHFNFMAYFQQPGAVEAEFAASPAEFFRRFLYGLSGDAPDGTLKALYQDKPAEARLLDGFPVPKVLPAWLTETDITGYANAFARTGIAGALGFYRNFDRDYEPLKELYRRTLNQPVLFIGGEKEAAVRFGNLEPMKAALPGLRRVVVIPGCGHWVQQERPDLVNREMISFLNQLSSTTKSGESS